MWDVNSRLFVKYLPPQKFCFTRTPEKNPSLITSRKKIIFKPPVKKILRPLPKTLFPSGTSSVIYT